MDTIAEATAVLQNKHQTEEKRAAAAHYLGENGTEETAYVLVSALDDDDYGVHWAASEGLAQLGDAAMPALLKRLISPDCSPRVIHGAKHVFHTSSSPAVRAETKQLVKAIHGSAQDIAVMRAASNLLQKLHIS